MRKIQEAVKILQDGGIIAYPTEAVYGLGCDPFNEAAVERLCHLKNRSEDKGFILIASAWEQLAPLINTVPPDALERAKATWPGPITWVFPASTTVPHLIRGNYPTIAVRITDHPIAHNICHAFGNPIVSTSANYEGKDPARDEETVKKIFDGKIDFIVSGFVGNLLNPTEIRDAITGKILRASPTKITRA